MENLFLNYNNCFHLKTNSRLLPAAASVSYYLFRFNTLDIIVASELNCAVPQQNKQHRAYSDTCSRRNGLSWSLANVVLLGKKQCSKTDKSAFNGNLIQLLSQEYDRIPNATSPPRPSASRGVLSHVCDNSCIKVPT